jgi:peptidyl-tRNA hydrolase
MLLVTVVASCLVWVVLGAAAGFFFRRWSWSNFTWTKLSEQDLQPASEGKAEKTSASPASLNSRRKERRARPSAAPGGTGKSTPSEDALEEMRLKMVLIVRKDLNLSPAETAAQASDAAISVIAKTVYSSISMPVWVDWYNWWSIYGVAKITLRCPDEQTFSEIVAAAQANKLPFAVVASNAVVALGPAPAEKLDPVTGALKLLS